MKRTLSTIAIVCLSMLMLTGCFFGNPNEDKTPSARFIIQNETIGVNESLALYLTDYEPNCKYTVFIDGKKVDNADDSYWPAFVADSSLIYSLKEGKHTVEVKEEGNYTLSLGKLEFNVENKIGINAYVNDPREQGLPSIHVEAVDPSTAIAKNATYSWKLNGQSIKPTEKGFDIPNSSVTAPEFTIELTVKVEGAEDVVVSRKFAFSTKPYAAQLPFSKDDTEIKFQTSSAWAALDDSYETYKLIDENGYSKVIGFDKIAKWIPSPGEKRYVTLEIDSKVFSGLDLNGSIKITIPER